MFPELFKIPFLDFAINTYGLLLATSCIIGLYLTARLAERDGLNRNHVYDLGMWIIVSGLIGSKLLMIVTEWNYYSENPRQIFTFDFFRSAGAFYGSFIVGLITSVVVMRIYRLPWWQTIDAFAPSIALGLAIGRLGCFSAGCCWGKPTTAAWGVHFTERGHEITGVPIIVSHLVDPVAREVWAQKLGDLLAPLYLHPTQLYESLATMIIFIALLWLYRHRAFNGQIILAYAMFYAIARFVIEFWRDDPRGSIFGLSTSQFIAIIFFVGSAAFYIYRLRQQRAGRDTMSATRAAA